MFDYDMFVKLGWTGLLAWNLKETVSVGKRLIRLETRVDNGISEKLSRLESNLDIHMREEEKRIPGSGVVVGIDKAGDLADGP